MSQRTEMVSFVKDLTFTEGFSMVDGTDPDIFKKVVTGYAIVRRTTKEGSDWLTSEPIFQTTEHEEIEEFGTKVYSKEDLVAVLSPSKLTLGVWGYIPASSVSFEEFKTGFYSIDTVFLGFEIEGQEKTDWTELLKLKIVCVLSKNFK